MRFRPLLLVILAAGIVLGVAGCSDDDDPVAPTASKTYFSIEIDADSGPMKAPMLDCEFAMGLTSNLPEVSFNGHEIPTFGYEGSILYGSVDIPYATTVDWEVRQGDKVVSGTLTLPTAPTEVTCNSMVLVPHTTVSVPEASEYVFAWTGGLADHYRGSFETYNGDNYDYRNWSTAETSITFGADPGEEPNYFYVRGVNGVMLVPGAVPNATGWADGYVSFRTPSNYFYLDLESPQAAPVTEAPLHQRLAEILD